MPFELSFQKSFPALRRPLCNKQALYPFIHSFYCVSADCFVCLWYDQ